MPFAPGDVTVYVPAYNAEATLGACLDGILAQSVMPARVLVIDDASAVPVKVRHGVDVVRHAGNRGLACARNTALAECGTALIASVDSDVVAGPAWLEILLETLNSRACAGVGGKMVERFQDGLGDRWRAVHMAQHWGDAPARNPRFLFGANSLFRVERLRVVGGYDMRCRTNNEDRLVSEALYAAGDELWYVPAAGCEHLRRDTCRSVLGGFWQWHHVKGILGGDFDAPAGIISRIDRVNFGIARYRFELDGSAGRSELLPLDAALPWVFCSRDLGLYAGRNRCRCPDILAACRDVIPGDIAAVLDEVVDVKGCVTECEPWAVEYMAEFRRCLNGSGFRELKL